VILTAFFDLRNGVEYSVCLKFLIWENTGKYSISWRFLETGNSEAGSVLIKIFKHKKPWGNAMFV